LIRRIPILAVAVACLLASSAGGAFAATAVDAQQNDTSGTTDTWQYSNLRLAQWFKAGTTGQLTSVAIDADSYGQQIEFEVIGLTTNDQFVGSVSGWTTITLTSPLSVLAGGNYYILISVPNKFQWMGECNTAYPGGKAQVLYQNAYSTVPAFGIAHSGSLGTLGYYCTQAFAFRTYVTTPDVATPVPTQAPTATATSAAKATAKAAAATAKAAAATAVMTPAADTAAPSAASTAAALTPAASDIAMVAAPPSTAAVQPSAAAAALASGSPDSGNSLPVFIVLAIVVVGLAGGGAWFAMKRRRHV
jgi:hypothetical protein